MLNKELCAEYTYRYGKIHKGQAVTEELEKNLPEIPDIGFTKPAQAMPDTYKEENPTSAYRSYYLFEKNHLFSWKNRDEPKWLQDFYSSFE